MKRAVVLFNLGGPDSPDAVYPFLRNLFRDPAILPLPALVRIPLSRRIARRREGEAREIYARLGGSSPLLNETERQRTALERALDEDPEVTTRVFIAMRYWKPETLETAFRVRDFSPDEVVLLPLYPQFSVTTTGSSIQAWQKAALEAGITASTRTICCYFGASGLIAAHVDLLRSELAKVRGPSRILFSAHGLPERVIRKGDPYQWQVERTVAAVMRALDRPDQEHVVCYQSKVGRLRWIGPSTSAEISRAARDGVGVVVVPIAFVSEHSETLVEIDVTLRDQALSEGVEDFVRVPTLGTHPSYVDALADLVLGSGEGVHPPGGRRLCPGVLSGCPCP